MCTMVGMGEEEGGGYLPTIPPGHIGDSNSGLPTYAPRVHHGHIPHLGPAHTAAHGGQRDSERLLGSREEDSPG